MGLWERRIWVAECARCKAQVSNERLPRKDFIHDLRTGGWYLEGKRVLCPECRVKHGLPHQNDVNERRA